MEQLKHIDLQDFCRRNIKSKVSHEEIDSVMSVVAAALRNIGPSAYKPDPPPGKDDLTWWVVECLVTLRYANDTSYKDLVASFLKGQSSLAASTALNTLCVFYGVTAEYIEEIAEFIRGAPWDDFNRVHDEAIGLASHYLSEHKEPILLRALIETLEDQNPTHEPGSLEERLAQERRDNAYAFLEGVMGVAPTGEGYISVDTSMLRIPYYSTAMVGAIIFSVARMFVFCHL